jgi:hypothetical protein
VTAAGLVGLAACKENTSPAASLVDEAAITSDVAASSGDAMATAVAGMTGNETTVGMAAPAVGDIDGDGKIEVVAHTREGVLYAWKSAGEVCPQKDEGITACRWLPFEEALRTIDEALAGAGADRPGFMKLIEAASSVPKPFDIVLLDGEDYGEEGNLERQDGEARQARQPESKPHDLLLSCEATTSSLLGSAVRRPRIPPERPGHSAPAAKPQPKATVSPGSRRRVSPNVRPGRDALTNARRCFNRRHRLCAGPTSFARGSCPSPRRWGRSASRCARCPWRPGPGPPRAIGA